MKRCCCAVVLWHRQMSARCEPTRAVLQPSVLRAAVLVLYEGSDGWQRLYQFRPQAAGKQPCSLQLVCRSHVRAALQLSGVCDLRPVEL